MGQSIRATVAGMLVAWCLLCPWSAFGEEKKQFRVCADPENLPFSNRQLEGFENKIADVIAKELGASPSYIWWGQRRGFIRNTMNATLKEGRCDVVIGVPAGYDLVRTTTPYYRSSYVFVYPKGKGLHLTSLDNPVLKKIKIGVHLLGDDYTNPPPVHELAKRGVVDNVIGFDTFYSSQNPPSTIIDAVATREDRCSHRVGARRRIFCRAPTGPIGDGPHPIRTRGSSLRLRHLNGRQTW